MKHEDPDAKISRQTGRDAQLVEKAVLNSMVEGVITLECSGKVYSANPSALRILDMDPEALIGLNIQDLMDSDHINKDFYEIFKGIISDGAPTHHKDVLFVRKDGQRLELSVSATFIELDVCSPGLEDVVVVFRDITAFKSMELMKRRAVDHLSHELKTPISIIQATLKTFTNKMDLQEKDLKRIERIQRRLKRLLEMQEVVEEILDPRSYNPGRIDVAQTLEKLISRIRTEADFRDVSLITDNMAPEIDFVDPTILDMCVRALVKNAIENSPDGSEVLVRTRRQKDSFFLEVKDRGIGIPVVDQDFIFQGFHHTLDTDLYQSKNPYEFAAGGKGLELMRLHALSESHPFLITFSSHRCIYIPRGEDVCPGDISLCKHVSNRADCENSGGSEFIVQFHA